MESIKKGLRADEKFHDFKIESLKDSSNEDLVWAGLEYVRKQIVLLAGAGLRSIKKWEAAMKVGDFVLAKEPGVRSAKLTERRQYYLDQGVRLVKILSRKRGVPMIITNSLIKARVYDPGGFVSNKERQVLEDGFTKMLKKRAEEITQGLCE